MVFSNDVIRYIGSGQRVRVLWLHNEQPFAFLIDIDKDNALPYELPLSELIESLQGENKIAELIDDPFFSIIDEDRLSEVAKLKRKAGMAIIKDLIDQKPAIFYTNRRCQLMISLDILKQGHSRVYRNLRRYWQRGQTPNALLPDYGNCGNPGQRKVQTDTKLGRPPKFVNEGIPITESVIEYFKVGIFRYYAKNEKFNLRKAYDKMLTECFCEKVTDDVTGAVKIIPKKVVNGNTFPTFNQFKYWFDQNTDLLDIKRRRASAKIYDKDMRGYISTSNAEVWGPGSRYQIDATILDLYIVSRHDRSRIIGRPVLYVIIDVFSRMIVGMYVGIEGPSWVTAMMALENCVADKQAYCAKYGIHIEPEDWPCHHLPAKLLGDRGEIASKIIDTLSNNFRVEIENTAPYRADWKGIVEQQFKLLPAHFKPFVEGYIQSDFRARGGQDYRLDAELDLDQITKILIHCVLTNNNQHQLLNYDKDHDLSKANIPAVPLDLWNWGIKNKSGYLRTYPAEEVRFSLLITGNASVTKQGIYFKKEYYTCPLAMQERWFDKARQDKRWSIEVRYDPRDMDVIYFINPNDSDLIEVCNKTPRSREYLGLSEWEIGQAQLAKQQVEEAHKPVEQMGKLELLVEIEKIAAEAKAMKPIVITESKHARTRGIRENRKVDQAIIQAKEAFKFGPEADNQGKPIPQNIVPFKQADEDYSEPDLLDILGQEDINNE